MTRPRPRRPSSQWKPHCERGHQLLDGVLHRQSSPSSRGVPMPACILGGLQPPCQHLGRACHAPFGQQGPSRAWVSCSLERLSHPRHPKRVAGRLPMESIFDTAINAPRRQTAAGTQGLFLLPFGPSPWNLYLAFADVPCHALYSRTCYSLTWKSQRRLASQYGGTCTGPLVASALLVKAAHPGFVRAPAWTVLTGRWARRRLLDLGRPLSSGISCLCLQPS